MAVDFISAVWGDSSYKPKHVYKKILQVETDEDIGVEFKVWKSLYKEASVVHRQDLDAKAKEKKAKKKGKTLS